jgi:hypothetical protein
VSETGGVDLVNVTAQSSASWSEAGRAPAPEETTDPRDDLERFRAEAGEERWDVFRRLPAERRQSLARSLLDDAAVAYVVAGSLAREGDLDEAVPVFARILVRGEDQTALHGRMGYDWIHDDDDALAGRILEALGRHLRTHLDEYTPSERARAERLLGAPALQARP